VTWFLVAVAAAMTAGLSIGIAFFGLPTLPTGSAGDANNVARPRQTVVVSLSEFQIDMSPMSVAPDALVEFVVTNDGTVQHDFKVDGEVGAPRLEPGEGYSFQISEVEGPIHAWCTVLGHREQGMEVTIQIGSGS